MSALKDESARKDTIYETNNFKTGLKRSYYKVELSLGYLSLQYGVLWRVFLIRNFAKSDSSFVWSD